MRASLRLAAAITTISLVTPCIAFAALPPPCAEAALVPPPKSVVPANLPSFAYTASGAPSGVTLTLQGPTSKTIEVTIGRTQGNTFELLPAEPLVAGSSYVLHYSSSCNGTPREAPYDVVAAAPFPTELGSVVTGPAVELEDFGTTRVDVKATYLLSDSAKAWARAMEFRLMFDGKPQQTAVTVGQDGRIEVTARGWCDAQNAARASHTLSLRGRVPFVFEHESAAIEQAFSCPAPNVRPPTDDSPVPPPPAPPSSARPVPGEGGGCAQSPASGTSGVGVSGLVVLSALSSWRRRAAKARAATVGSSRR